MKIIAHQGFTEKYPENTLIAFKEAFKKGVDAIEFDVHFSSDQELIVHHDYNLKHPSGGKGIISQVSSTYIKTIDAGSWFDPKFSNEKIPFLAEIFQLLGKNIQYEIELKGYTKKFLEKVLRLVNTYNLLENIEFTSPHLFIISYLKQLYPKARVGMFAQSLPDWMDKKLGKEIIKNNALLGNINVLHIPFSLLSKEYIEELHKENLLVHAADCRTKEELKNAYKLGVDQLSTNLLESAIIYKRKYEK